MYEWHLTEHVKKRWLERFENKTRTLEECLDLSKKIKPHLRKKLLNNTKSEKHRLHLSRRDSGYYYRISGNAVFVLDNLRVVTVFRKPD